MKKKVHFKAPALSISGYGTHARQIFRWLESKDIDLTVELLNWGITSWHVNPNAENGLIGRIMSKSRPAPQDVDVVISLQLPNEWKRHPNAFNIGMSAVVETDRCNPAWIEACNNMDMVVVPTTFTKNVLLNSGKLNKDIVVVGESFPDEVYQEQDELSLPQITTKTNFLVVGQITGVKPEMDRKNLFYTVKWFCEAFSGRDDVSLVIKTNLGTNSSFMRNQTNEIFRKLVGEVRKGMFPKIHVLTGEMTTGEMISLYESSKMSALISLTRGEGFGLPLLEAAACSLPVICTNWSGHLDFMNKGKFVSIDYDLANIPQTRIDNSVFVNGAKWAEPREADFKKKILKFENKKEIPVEWANSLSKKVHEHFSFKAISEEYDKKLGSILS